MDNRNDEDRKQHNEWKQMQLLHKSAVPYVKEILKKRGLFVYPTEEGSNYDFFIGTDINESPLVRMVVLSSYGDFLIDHTMARYIEKGYSDFYVVFVIRSPNNMLESSTPLVMFGRRVLQILRDTGEDYKKPFGRISGKYLLNQQNLHSWNDFYPKPKNTESNWGKPRE